MSNSTIPVSKLNITRIALVALVTGAVAIGFAPIFVRLSETGPVATGFGGCFALFLYFGCGPTPKRIILPRLSYRRAAILSC